MRVYAFTSKTVFSRCTSIRQAMSISKNEKLVYVHVKGIPNPWFVHPVKNGKVQYDKVLKHPQMKARLSRALRRPKAMSPVLGMGYESPTAMFDDPYERMFESQED